MQEDGVLTTTTVVITNGQSLSPAVPLYKYRLVGIIMPAAWNAAGLTFQVSFDGSSFSNLYDSAGNEISYTVADSRYVQLPPATWTGIRSIKIRSGTSGVPVNQTADRTLTLVTRPLSS